MMNESYDLLVAGAGAAGIAGAIRAAAEGLRVVVVERNVPGGYAREASRIETVPGFPIGPDGEELTRRSLAQATRFGVELRAGAPAVGLERLAWGFKVELGDGSTIDAAAVLAATGAERRRLHAPGVHELLGCGIYFGLPTPIPSTFHRADVLVAGTLPAAAEAAVELTELCRSVVLVTRRGRFAGRVPNELRARLQDRLNLTVRLSSEIIEACGVASLETVTLRHRRTGRCHVLPVTALLLVGGDMPRTAWLGDAAARDEDGFVLVGQQLPAGPSGSPWPLQRRPSPHETSVPGLFAAGAIRSAPAPSVLGAIDEGVSAAREVVAYLRSTRVREEPRVAQTTFTIAENWG